jgi:hypothetical protein
MEERMRSEKGVHVVREGTTRRRVVRKLGRRRGDGSMMALGTW